MNLLSSFRPLLATATGTADGKNLVSSWSAPLCRIIGPPTAERILIDVWFRRHTKITGGEATLQPGFVVLHSPHGMAGPNHDKRGRTLSHTRYRYFALYGYGGVTVS